MARTVLLILAAIVLLGFYVAVYNGLGSTG